MGVVNRITLKKKSAAMLKEIYCVNKFLQIEECEVLANYTIFGSKLKHKNIHKLFRLELEQFIVRAQSLRPINISELVKFDF